MNERVKRFSIGAAIFLLSLVPFEANLGQGQTQLLKPCLAATTPKKNEDTNTSKKKGRKRQKTKNGKKERTDQQQAKKSDCN